MADRRTHLIAITLIENTFQFFSPINDIFGIVFFYAQWHNILLALLPWIAAHATYSLIVPYASKLVGRLGVQRSLFIAFSCLSSSAIPAYLYHLNPSNTLIIIWWIWTNLYRFTYHPARVYIIGRCTTHHQRGSEIAVRRMTFILTKIISPLLAGLLVQRFGLPLTISLYSLITVVAVIPIRYLPRMYFHVDYHPLYWLKRYRFQRMVYYNFIASLGTYSNHLWMLFIFLAFSGSYKALGGLVAITTTITMVLMYLFGNYLNRHSRKRSLAHMFYLSAVALFARSLSAIPIPVADTLTRLTRNLKYEAQDVVVYDTMTYKVKPSYRDESIIFEESTIDMTIAFAFLLQGFLAASFGIRPTFIIIGILIILLTALNPFRAHASLQPNP